MKVVLRDLLKRFANAERAAVNKINLVIEKGELAVLLGPSGCGKTTTLRMIAGLEQPDSGRITIAERDITDLAPKDRRLAMVFQNFSMYPTMNVYDNIAFPLHAIKMKRKEIDRTVREVARLVNIDHLLERSLRQVSGGEAQRVALARAMVRRPEVFLMDEPLSNLDAKLRVQLRTEIKRLHQDTGATFIFVTHDQEEAMTLGDKIIVMNNGDIQQVGTPHEVFFGPRNAFVANFVGTPSMNMLSGRIVADEGGYRLRLPGFELSLPARFADGLGKMKSDGVIWGIRPEAIKLVSAPGENTVSGQVELVEALGSRDLIFARTAEQLFGVIVDAQESAPVGAPCHLHFAGEQMHLFDAASERSLLNDKPPSVPPSGWGEAVQRR
ncbi:MAG: ABC transporter ATP-binding protein [Chloroflexota bacterium]|nr:ABC transporter ATP-binding protein [Chloroflexota bacterium]